MTEETFIERIRSAGGRGFIVGGFVRDRLRGQAAHDKDYVVTGLATEAFTALFPEARRVGRSFPVYLLDIGGVSSEVALARTERKQGRGYHGFAFSTSPDISIEDDLWRRDTTINAIALELPDETLIDPYDGKGAIRDHVIRAVSPHFLDDPVRALRAARQAAQLEYEIAPDTVAMMRQARQELSEEPWERVFGELEKALGARRPSLFFRWLARAGLLDITFPEIARLIGKTQPPAFHPEGDAYEHTLIALDFAASLNPSLMVRFCALVHDIGKGETPPEDLPHHYGHDQRGAKVLERWNETRPLPGKWRQAARLVITQHMRQATLKKPRKIVELLLSIHKSPLSIGDFRDVIRSDRGDRGGLPTFLERGEELIAAMLSVRGQDAPPNLSGEEIGIWLLAERARVLHRLLAEDPPPS